MWAWLLLARKPTSWSLPLFLKLRRRSPFSLAAVVGISAVFSGAWATKWTIWESSSLSWAWVTKTRACVLSKYSPLCIVRSHWSVWNRTHAQLCAARRALGMRRSAKPQRIRMGPNQNRNGPPHTAYYGLWQIWGVILCLRRLRSLAQDATMLCLVLSRRWNPFWP